MFFNMGIGFYDYFSYCEISSRHFDIRCLKAIILWVYNLRRLLPHEFVENRHLFGTIVLSCEVEVDNQSALIDLTFATVLLRVLLMLLPSNAWSELVFVIVEMPGIRFFLWVSFKLWESLKGSWKVLLRLFIRSFSIMNDWLLHQKKFAEMKGVACCLLLCEWSS